MKLSVVCTPVVAAAAAVMATLSIGSSHVVAQEIPDPVIDVIVTPQNPRLGERIRTDVEFCVPDSTTEGDTFSVTLPSELTFLPSGFDVRDPDGLLVADATLAGAPFVVTFTFTDYVDTRTDVCGSAFFESRFDDTLTVGEDRRLVYTVNDDVFDFVITPRERLGTVGDDIVGKGGFFTDPTDECRTSVDSCLEWRVRSRVGPYDSVQISDAPISGITFECDQIEVTLRRVEANGELGPLVSLEAAGVTTTVQCGPGVDVTVNDLPAGLIVRLVLRGTPDAPSPAGGVTYENSAVITHIVGDEIVDRDEVSIRHRSSLVGGEAVGVTPATTTTTTTAPTTTTAAPTTTTIAPTTTTTIVESGAPTTTTTIAGSGAPTTTVPPTVSPQLPATGSGQRLAPAAAVLLLAGVALVTVASRRTT